jgi:hypothetical protein
MSLTPRPQRDHVREIRQQLPERLFGRSRSTLCMGSAHSLVLIASIAVIRNARAALAAAES